MTLQWSQMGLTDGLTFMMFPCSLSSPAGATPKGCRGCYFSTGLAVAVDDATAREVVGRELHDDAVFGDDADVVLPHLAGNRREDFVPVLSSTRNIALGRASEITPSISMTPSFLAIASLTLLQIGRSAVGDWFVVLHRRTRRIKAQSTKDQLYTPTRAPATNRRRSPRASVSRAGNR